MVLRVTSAERTFVAEPTTMTSVLATTQRVSPRAHLKVTKHMLMAVLAQSAQRTSSFLGHLLVPGVQGLPFSVSARYG